MMQDHSELRQIIVLTISTIVGLPLALVLLVPLILVLWHSAFRRQQDRAVLNRVHALTDTRPADWPKFSTIYVGHDEPDGRSGAAGNVSAEGISDKWGCVRSMAWASIMPISCLRTAPTPTTSESSLTSRVPTRRGWLWFPTSHAPFVASRPLHSRPDALELHPIRPSLAFGPSIDSTAATSASGTDTIRVVVLVRMPYIEPKRREDGKAGLPHMEFGVSDCVQASRFQTRA
ncbi:hypothetical protein C8T65DRAFT_674413 [Cerioporus squamosus]|nr:hypothetical protein C8T65DRAFT_674413 [Cerioporus squamosus]